MEPICFEAVLAYVFLRHEEIVTADEYENRLNALYLKDPKNDILLNLEWQKDTKESIIYINESIDFEKLDSALFGKCLMERISVFYKEGHADLRNFAAKMYDLWKNLPDSIQHQQPFWILSYGDDPLSWGDEKQCRSIYEKMMNYYNT